MQRLMDKITTINEKITKKLDKTVEQINEKNKIFEAKMKKNIKDQLDKVNKQIDRNKDNASKL